MIIKEEFYNFNQKLIDRLWELLCIVGSDPYLTEEKFDDALGTDNRIAYWTNYDYYIDPEYCESDEDILQAITDIENEYFPELVEMNMFEGIPEYERYIRKHKINLDKFR